MISVVVPVFNVEKYISICIDSLLDQTYKDIEIILINDGSSDRSGFICDEYQEKYDKVISIHQNNMGSGIARNKGLEIAKGDYILFCDPDDWLPSNAIEKHLEAMLQNNSDMTVCFIKDFIYDTNDNFIKTVDRNKFKQSYYSQLEFRNAYFRLYDKVNFRSPCNKLYSKKIIDDHKIKFPDLRRSQDIVFNNEYLKHVKKVEIIDLDLYNRRVVENAIYKKKLGNLLESRKKTYESYERLLEFWEINSDKGEEFLTKILFEYIWSYYSFILKDGEISLYQKYKKLKDRSIEEFANELRKKKMLRKFSNQKAKFIYILIYYNGELLLLALFSLKGKVFSSL